MGNKQTEHVKRQKFRKKLLKWGMPPDEVELCVSQFRERQYQKALGYLESDAPDCTRAEYVRWLKKQPEAQNSGAKVLSFGEDYEPPSDKGYKPPPYDPLLNGAARATGSAARAVKRRTTITKFQYNKENS